MSSASIFFEECMIADSGTDSGRLSASILDDKVRVCSSSCTSRRTGWSVPSASISRIGQWGRNGSPLRFVILQLDRTISPRWLKSRRVGEPLPSLMRPLRLVTQNTQVHPQQVQVARPTWNEGAGAMTRTSRRIGPEHNVSNQPDKWLTDWFICGQEHTSCGLPVWCVPPGAPSSCGGRSVRGVEEQRKPAQPHSTAAACGEGLHRRSAVHKKVTTG